MKYETGYYIKSILIAIWIAVIWLKIGVQPAILHTLLLIYFKLEKKIP